MLTITERQFVEGPNLFLKQSALLIQTEFASLPFALLKVPVSRGLGGLALLGTVPGGETLLDLLQTACETLGERATGFRLAIELAARLQEPSVIRPGVGRVLSVAGSELVGLVPCEVEDIGLCAWELGCKLAFAKQFQEQLPVGQLQALTELHEEFRRRVRSKGLDQLSVAVARRALELGIPVYRPDPATRMLQFGQGRYAKTSFETLSLPANFFSIIRAREKWQSLQRLRQLGLPTFLSGVALSAEQAIALAHRIGGKVVVKPLTGGKGEGVSVGVSDDEQVRRAYRLASRSNAKVLVEAMGEGDDYRLLVVDGSLIAAARRLPALATGDGSSTVGQLIAKINEDPRRGGPYEKLLDRISIDQRLDDLLAAQSLAWESVPEKGRVVRLSLAANISQGGTAEDVTGQVHPDNRQAAERAAIALDLPVAGIDFISPDISRSWREVGGAIIEPNSPPGLRPHWIANPEHDVVTPLVRRMFPEGAPCRVPIAGITGSLGKTTTCQMVGAIALAAGRVTARTTTQGAWAGDYALGQGDCSGGRMAFDLLTDPTIDMAIFEFARGGMLKRGMKIDGVDVSAVLNLRGNHVGMEGINTLEEMAQLKGTVLRSTRELAWLNASDPNVLAMSKYVTGARLGLVSVDPESESLAAHAGEGGLTVSLAGRGEAAVLRLAEGDEALFEMAVADIPAARAGRNRAIVENAAFAIGVAHGLGLPGEAMRSGLAGFVSNSEQNPGRHNWVEGLPFQALVHWADGAVALREFMALLAAEPAENGAVLCLSSPGNRDDEWLREVGREAAGNFQQVVVSDLTDLRDRAPGEAAALLREGLLEAGQETDTIALAPDAEAAMRQAIAMTGSGQRLVIVTYDTQLAIQLLQTARAESGDPDAV